MNDEQHDRGEFEEYHAEDEAPRWTLRRVIFLAIILITLIAFLLYTIAPALFPPAPPPPPRPPLQGA